MPAIIDQIFAQSQAGNANGAIMPGFAEGARLSMERRRLDSELATEDLQRQTMRDMATFNNQMQRLKLEEARLNMQKMVGLQSAATEASRLVAWAIQEPSVLDTPEFRSHTATALNNPLVMATDNGKTLFEMVRGRQAHNAALAAGMEQVGAMVKTPDGTITMAPKVPTPEEQKARGVYQSGTDAHGRPIFHALPVNLDPTVLTKLGMKPKRTSASGQVIWEAEDPNLTSAKVEYFKSMSQWMGMKTAALKAHAQGQTEAQFLQAMVKSLAANPINAAKTPEQLAEMARAIYRGVKSDPQGLFDDLPPGDPFGDNQPTAPPPTGTDLEPRDE